MNKYRSHARMLIIGLVLIATGTLAPRADDETVRLQRHFRAVEAELLARDVSALNAEQRAARMQHIATLRSYGEAGTFPHNHSLAQQTPFFRDEHGTLCAMGFLIAMSGATDLSERIARGQNNAYIRDLANDPELIAWLEQNGLSVEEAARIQPAYDWNPPETREERQNYELATSLTAAAQGGAIAWTLVADPRRAGYAPGIAAMGVGGFAVGLGFGGIGSSQSDPLIGVNIIGGLVTSVAGAIYTVRVIRARGNDDARAQPVGTLQRVQPVVASDLDGRTRVGLNLRF